MNNFNSYSPRASLAITVSDPPFPRHNKKPGNCNQLPGLENTYGSRFTFHVSRITPLTPLPGCTPQWAGRCKPGSGRHTRYPHG